jgi:hypothetical protein
VAALCACSLDGARKEAARHDRAHLESVGAIAPGPSEAPGRSQKYRLDEKRRFPCEAGKGKNWGRRASKAFPLEVTVTSLEQLTGW